MQHTPNHPWLAHYPETINWHEKFTPKPLYFLLDEAAFHYADQVALDFFGKTYSYRKLQEMTNRVARGLQDMGVGPGSKVGLFMPNCPQFVMAYFAILKVGATVVNFNPLYSTHEIEHQIRDANVEVIFTVNLNTIYPKLVPFLEGTSLRKIVVCQFQEAMPLAKAALFTAAKAKDIARPPKDDKHIAFNTLLKYDDIVICPKMDAERDIAVLQYTGGTTGVPKGACLTHANLYVNAQQCSRWMHGLEAGQETLLAIIPFFHVFAMTVAMNFAIMNGFRVIIHPRFDLKQVLGDIDKKRPTIMPGVSTLYATIANYKQLDRYDLTSIKMCISGGGPLPIEVKEKFETLTGCALVEGYGLTESSPVTSCNPLFGSQKTGSIGLPFPETIMEIVDKDDQKTLLPPGEIGEVCIRGPQVMQGYYNKPGETDKVLKNGRLHTGDLGYMDEEGYFYIVDRLKEMIIVGGYNVYPRNVEEVLYTHPAIAEAAVIGLEHTRRGQMIKAYIVLKEGIKEGDMVPVTHLADASEKDGAEDAALAPEALTEASLKAYLRQHMSAYAVPHVVEFRESLPKSPVGKILKKELLAEEKAKGEA